MASDRLERGSRPAPGFWDNFSELIRPRGELGEPLQDNEVTAIEEEGFVFEAIQAYLNRLDNQRDPQAQRNAAMLRGAFNDLLAQIPDSPKEAVRPEAA